MKKVTPILLGLIVLATLCGFAIAKESADDLQETTTDYIVLRFSMYGFAGKNQVIVSYGGTKIEKLEIPKETMKAVGTTNFVIDLLNQFSVKGYTLVSTTNSAEAGGTEVICFLKKTK